MTTYGSVCSGIEAASLAWESLGMKPVWFAEIEKFPSAILAARWPNVPNLGDMTQLASYIRLGLITAPDVLVGGTPCQAFSLAGMRKGLEDPRGALTIKYVEIANAIDEQRSGDECVVVWENVPGVLSDKTNAFGCFLAALVGESEALEPPGGKWSNAGVVLGPQRTAAWRVLDAQYFGVAQRRRRVFVVASARAGFDPTKVLFERKGVRRDTAPSRETGEAVASYAPSSIGAYSEGVGTLRANGGDYGGVANVSLLGGIDYENNAHGPNDPTGPLLKGSPTGGGRPLPAICMAHGQAGAEIRSDGEPSLTCNHEAPIVFNWNAQPDQMNFSSSSTPSLTCSQQAAVMQVAFCQNTRDEVRLMGGDETIVGALAAEAGMKQTTCYIAECLPINTQIITRGGALGRNTGFGLGEANDPSYTIQAGHSHGVFYGFTVRRLMPVECELLQGMPRNHTAIPGSADGPRYKAIGNSKAVPVVRWIGARILWELLV